MLVVDKPGGMTSHDVVAAARRHLREQRIGHTGTLDPLATGVLPLACGRATRLVRFMSASDKSYDATVLFGLTTDTYDTTGRPEQTSPLRPSDPEVAAALSHLRAADRQTPPPYSAKKVDGRRAYALARRDEPVRLEPVPVRLLAVDVLERSPDRLRVRLTCSAGFYVRSFAHDLGQRLGMGACLESLRRIRSGAFGLEQAVSLEQLVRGEAQGAVIPLGLLLPDFEAVVVGPWGRDRVKHGQPLGVADIVSHRPGAGGGAGTPPGWTRILDEQGLLLGLGRREVPEGPLRPQVVLI